VLELSLLAQNSPAHVVCTAAGLIQALMVKAFVPANALYPLNNTGDATGAVVEKAMALPAIVSIVHWLGPIVTKLFTVTVSVPAAVVTIIVAP
ncbi:hypothetical protein GUJ73_25105, partial|uniref:hypothetical protein n=1 Tax=Escherichia coli TaxID=562 RepID=UPI001443D5F6